jgi:hypothetical protein
VLAKLHKLNVYSAPSGFIRSRVDTPPDKNHSGILVVSLPIAHKGGEMIVRHGPHGSRRLMFAFSHSLDTIQWAAVYSDCEQDVLTVTSGHRITLTYNLFSTPLLPSRLAGLPKPVITAHCMSLHWKLSQALESPSFFPNGRVLAMVLSHIYSHTSKQSCFFSGALKGSDMTSFEICGALKLGTYVRPLTDHLVDVTRWTRGRQNPEKEDEGKVWASQWDGHDRLINATQMGLEFAPTELEDSMCETVEFQEHMQRRLKTPEDWQTNRLVKEECTTWLQQG